MHSALTRVQAVFNYFTTVAVVIASLASLSVLLHPEPTDLESLGTLPLAAGLAVTDAVAPAGLKWPNDVLIDGRKLCGILADVVSIATDQPSPMPFNP